jgi:hypothetical protein
MLGRRSAAMTLDVYPDLFDDDLDGVADRLDALVCTPRVPDAEVVSITDDATTGR